MEASADEFAAMGESVLLLSERAWCQFSRKSRLRKFGEISEMAGLFACVGKEISPQTRTDNRRIALR